MAEVKVNDLFQNTEIALSHELIGRRLSCGKVSAMILDTQAYPRSDTEKPLYRPLLELEPGGVYTSRQYNSVLMHILASGGGCVSIRAIEIGGGMVEGPGRVTAALGIELPKNRGRLDEGRNGDLTLLLETPPSDPKPVQTKSLANGFGEAVLKRHLPQLVVVYRKRRREGEPRSFKDFLNSCLTSCSTEAALRRFLQK